MSEVERRAVACFKALAIGDAIGKQTETLSYADVRLRYPQGIRGFEGTPGEVIPRYRGKRYEWKIGETTDDTEQTLAVTRAILDSGDVRHESIGRELLKCTKSVHPGVSMWAFVQAGDPSRVATTGDGCGAAMRVAPVGVFFSKPDDITRGAYECARPTHGGQLGIAAATAVAKAISAAINGQFPTVLDELTDCIYADLSTRPLNIDYIAENYFPNTPQTIVPLAIALALITQSAEETTLIAANIGGDADSVASIGSAIAGALWPETVNEEWFEVVSAINYDDVVEPARALAAIRR